MGHACMCAHKCAHMCIHWNITQPFKKNKEILPFATTCLDLEGVMLSEIRQMVKEKHYDLTYVECKTTKTNIQKPKKKFIEKETKPVVTRGRGERG